MSNAPAPTRKPRIPISNRIGCWLLGFGYALCSTPATRRALILRPQRFTAYGEYVIATLNVTRSKQTEP